jgi:hypothetical protein
MSKCADSPSVSHWNTQTVTTRVVETVVAGLLILMMAACDVGPNYKRPATSTPQSFREALAHRVTNTFRSGGKQIRWRAGQLFFQWGRV